MINVWLWKVWKITIHSNNSFLIWCKKLPRKYFLQVWKSIIVRRSQSGEYSGCSSNSYFNLLNFAIVKTLVWTCIILRKNEFLFLEKAFLHEFSHPTNQKVAIILRVYCFIILKIINQQRTDHTCDLRKLLP